MEKIYFIIPVILCLAAYFEYHNLQMLRKEYYELPKDYHSVFIAVLVCAVLSVAIAFFLPQVTSGYQAEREKIESSLEDADLVKGYLNNEIDMTRDEALDSLHNLYKKLYPKEW